jgi:hypothetical protein
LQATSGSGTYKSRDDAKLARSTIKACPKAPDEDKKGESGAKN